MGTFICNIFIVDFLLLIWFRVNQPSSTLSSDSPTLWSSTCCESKPSMWQIWWGGVFLKATGTLRSAIWYKYFSFPFCLPLLLHILHTISESLPVNVLEILYSSSNHLYHLFILCRPMRRASANWRISSRLCLLWTRRARCLTCRRTITQWQNCRQPLRPSGYKTHANRHVKC